jgi:hypothetical protein
MRVAVRRAYGWSREFIVVALVLARIELSLRTEELTATCRRVGVRLDLEPAPDLVGGGPVLPARARKSARVVGVVLHRWPWGDTCLRQCLLLGHRLRHLGPTMRIGVRHTEDGSFSAHSWLEIDGRALDQGATLFASLANRPTP